MSEYILEELALEQSAAAAETLEFTAPGRFVDVPLTEEAAFDFGAEETVASTTLGAQALLGGLIVETLAVLVAEQQYLDNLDLEGTHVPNTEETSTLPSHSDPITAAHQSLNRGPFTRPTLVLEDPWVLPQRDRETFEDPWILPLTAVESAPRRRTKKVVPDTVVEFAPPAVSTHPSYLTTTQRFYQPEQLLHYGTKINKKHRRKAARKS